MRFSTLTKLGMNYSAASSGELNPQRLKRSRKPHLTDKLKTGDIMTGKVPEKIEEHYGISVPSCPVRIITEKIAYPFETDTGRQRKTRSSDKKYLTA
jgi:hypothetical protein